MSANNGSWKEAAEIILRCKISNFVASATDGSFLCDTRTKTIRVECGTPEWHAITTLNGILQDSKGLDPAEFVQTYGNAYCPPEEEPVKHHMSFDELLQQAVQHTVVDFIRKGDWMKLDYNAKINIDSSWLRQMHSGVDMNAVMTLVKSQVEQKIADGIINSMASELANDIKSIMSNKELREDLRSVLRSKIRSVQSALCE